MCTDCERDRHKQCAQRGQMREVVCQCDCPTATSARRMLRVQPPATPPTHPDQQTDMLIPVYGLLDLWMALGMDSEDFEAHYLTHGYADTWARMLQAVRDLNNGLKAIEREESAAAASLGVTENGDPLYRRARAALDAITEVTAVTVDVTPQIDVRDGYGNAVRRTLEATVTITGPVQ